MINLLIDTLETLGFVDGETIIKQGTLAPNSAYPDSFVTFWTNYTADNLHFDNDTHSVDWQFGVNYYSNNPSNILTVPSLIRSTLKNAGFISQGKGNDIPSDVISHTGWAMTFVYNETENNF